MVEKYNLAVKRDRLTKQEKELVIKSYREAVNIGDVLMENTNIFLFSETLNTMTNEEKERVLAEARESAKEQEKRQKILSHQKWLEERHLKIIYLKK